MPEYVLVDGPLAGQVLGSSDHHLIGEALLIEVVDIAQAPEDVPRYDYRVATEPAGACPGSLRQAVR